MQWNNTTTRLFVAMLGFGLLMGIVFPFYAQFFVTWKPGLQVYFNIGCLVAGSLIGLINYGLMKFTIGRCLGKVSAALTQMAQGELCDPIENCGTDALGRLAGSLNVLVEYLQQAAAAMNRLSAGDLGIDFRPKGPKDAFGNALQPMIATLRTVVTDVHMASDSVSATSAHLLSSSDALSQATRTQTDSYDQTSAAISHIAVRVKALDDSARILGDRVGAVGQQSEDLAGAVVQTSSSIAELAASIRQVESHVASATSDAGSATKAAEAGDAAVVQAIQGMGAISSTIDEIARMIEVLEGRSGDINSIVETIDDIAEQTNLLALNAAIEAARAGDAGRGFAVVSDEVRKLAVRSSHATKEIGSLVSSIQAETRQAVGLARLGTRKAEDGVQQAQQAGRALAEIKEEASRVKTLLDSVSVATREQTQASAQIVTAAQMMETVNERVLAAITDMTEATRIVAQAAHEQRLEVDHLGPALEDFDASARSTATASAGMASTSGSLSSAAQELQAAVSFFQLPRNLKPSPTLPRPFTAPAPQQERSPREPALGTAP